MLFLAHLIKEGKGENGIYIYIYFSDWEILILNLVFWDLRILGRGKKRKAHGAL